MRRIGRLKVLGRVAIAFYCVGISTTSFAGSATALYNDQVIEIERTLADPNDLWVTPKDLTRVNGFVLKPEGACRDEICIRVLQDRDSDLLVTRRGERWFNVTELARKLRQAYAFDHESSTWSFGQVPAIRTAFLQSAKAPDFELKDRKGKTIRLADFRGKKVLIVTWSSW